MSKEYKLWGPSYHFFPYAQNSP